ncbi:hypothetical protein [Nitrobacter sp.]|uniref:hypothetical protein n=1 Tax=Nitrobacter sp. TaxID=29420 RepID=UPI00399D6DFB
MNLRETPTPTIAREDAAFIEMAGDGLHAHRAGHAVPLQEQAIDQPHSVGVERVDFQFLLGLRSALLSRDDAIADRRQRSIPEALPRILVHGAQDVLGVFL